MPHEIDTARWIKTVCDALSEHHIPFELAGDTLHLPYHGETISFGTGLGTVDLNPYEYAPESIPEHCLGLLREAPHLSSFGTSESGWWAGRPMLTLRVLEPQEGVLKFPSCRRAVQSYEDQGWMEKVMVKNAIVRIVGTSASDPLGDSLPIVGGLVNAIRRKFTNPYHLEIITNFDMECPDWLDRQVSSFIVCGTAREVPDLPHKRGYKKYVASPKAVFSFTARSQEDIELIAGLGLPNTRVGIMPDLDCDPGTRNVLKAACAEPCFRYLGIIV